MANPAHVAVLLQGVRAWNDWFKKQREADPDFRADLSGFDILSEEAQESGLYGAWQWGHSRFWCVGPNLRGIEFPEADLKGIRLEGADIREANLQGARLEEANLQGAGLQSANLQGAELPEANLQGANFLWANLQGAGLQEANLQGAGLQEANLQRAGLQEANLQGAELWGANFQKAKLEKANLQEAELREADFQEAKLWKANLQGANLQGAKLQGANFLGANLQGARLQSASLQGAILWRANFQGAKLWEASLQRAELLEANLQGAKLWEANLQGAELWRADLQGAELAEVNLIHCNFAGADFSNADLTGVRYNGRSFFRTPVAGLAKCCWLLSLKQLPIDRLMEVPKTKYQGIRVETCHGNQRFRRYAMDQAYLEELKNSHKRWDRWVYKLWLWTSDCGRSFLLWALWSIFFALIFGVAYAGYPPLPWLPDWMQTLLADITPKIDLPQYGSSFSPFYFSIVTFTTLGFGDIHPLNQAGEICVTIEVILGYVMLGGLISIFANKLARRSG